MQSSNNKRFSMSIFVVEFLSIIFSVSLALGLNELRQDYNRQALVQTALRRIKLEMTRNSEFLEKRLPYYTSLVDTLDEVIRVHGKDASFMSVRIPGFSGINPPLLRNSSFQTAISTQAFSSIDYDLADQLSFAYSLQATYLKWIDIYVGAIAVKDEVSLQRIQLMFKEMAFVGHEVLSTEQAILKLLPGQPATD